MSGALVELHALDRSPRDLARLRAFYDGLYTRAFPDPDERESYENMVLALADDGKDGNRYFLVLAEREGEAIGGGVGDYFARSSCGVIEFLVVDDASRREGIGTRLERYLYDAARDAAERIDQPLRVMAAEINDPWAKSGVPDTFDPVRRLAFWERLGYRRLPFHYVQPALSSEQSAVETLLLLGKLDANDQSRSIATRTVAAFLADYLTYAMRIADPETSAEFREMRAALARTERLELEPICNAEAA